MISDNTGEMIGWFMRITGTILILILSCVAIAHATSESEYIKKRSNLIKEIEGEVRETSSYLGKSKLNPKVMEAMEKIPRHEFVPESLRSYAYANQPLPIGHGQTISQPYIVALMTDLLNVKPGDKVFELGTGSGYQAAILSPLVKEVYTIEIVPPLGEKARERLQKLGYNNVKVRIGDGYYGWKEHAPFDAIIVTAAANHIPPPLLEQLKPGGRMVIPIGGPFSIQQLMLVEKDQKGNFTTKQVLPVSFVPLRRKS